MLLVLAFRKHFSRVVTPRHPLFSALLATTLACRPEGYQPPQEPTPVVDPLPDDQDELTHRALYGTDLASPAILKPPADAEITPTGLTQVTLSKGNGTASPGPDDTVIMHYRGWDTQGHRFDDTVTRGQPDTVRLSALAPGWAEALSTMVPGEKRRLWIPARLAFGPVPTPERPNGDVVLDVELVDVVKALPPPEVPSDLTDPPRDAITTTTGLVYKVLTRGNGQRTPRPSERVLVHYSGWDMDGKLFDSSVMRGEPIAFGVDEVIPGWTEALQLMHEGDQIRVWIPGNLAYGDKPDNPNVPAGRLCFDVQLIQIQ
jgi:FKBP-type peptidyl-prolyl cis-trans isomerase